MNSELFEMYRRPEELVLPELMSIGWCSTDYPRFGGPRTDGQDGFEVGYLERGSIEWWTEDGLDEAGPGSVIIDWPGDWQGGVDAIVHPCQRFWVRFNFPPRGELPGLSPQTIEALQKWFGGMHARHFPASPQIKMYFEQILGQQREPDSFAEDVSRAAFHQILFLAVHSQERYLQVVRTPAVREAQAFFDTHVSEDIMVEDVARRVDLSVGYFHELFVREVGFTPAHYHLRRRIAAAKRELIYSETSITAMSVDLGFSSSQYFATAFKKVVGISPGSYRVLREAGWKERGIDGS